jgi:DNA-binding transcriptional MerR regulator
MFLIRIPDDTVNKLTSIADSQGRSFNEYLAEILEQAVRAHELGCSLKEIVDLYERTAMKKEPAEEVELIEEPSIEDTFERTLAKLRPEITKSEEYKMLSGFVSEITR